MKKKKRGGGGRIHDLGSEKRSWGVRKEKLGVGRCRRGALKSEGGIKIQEEGKKNVNVAARRRRGKHGHGAGIEWADGPD